jgi:hypothetical protein
MGRGWRAFLHGATQAFNVFPPPRAMPKIVERSDAEAIRSDWEAVGQDLRRALDSVRKEDDRE